jgi:UDP-N-acetylmuramoyl-L-alanyl-D-glutamate--2,6-diaminopimelate ligase
LKPEAAALTNIDDKNGMVMLQNTKAKKYTYALKSPADFKTKILENQISGLVLHLENTEVWTRLIGKFNAYNLLALYSVSQILGEDKLEVLTAISNLQSVDGRFQQFKSDSGISCIVDYAHTPDALENVLDTIQNFTGDNHIITVIGCGGDRDKTKRPEMAKIAAKMSNQVILTSDNPRTENPESILDDMEAGLDPVMAAKSLRISDRDQAIKTAAMLSQPNSIVLIAGKGHEKYQDIQGTKHPFDDFAKAKEHFIKLKK